MNTKTNDLLARFGAAVLECLAQTPEWNAETLDAIAGEAYALKLATGDASGQFRVIGVDSPEVLPGVPIAPLSLHPAADRILSFIAERLFEGGEMPLSDEKILGSDETLGSALLAYNEACQAAEYRARYGKEIGAMPRERASIAMGQAAQASNEAGSAARVALGIFPGETSGALLLVFHDGSEVFAIDLVHSQSDAKARAEESAHDTGGNVSCSIIPLSLVLKAPALKAALSGLFGAFHVPDDGLEGPALDAYEAAADIL